MSLARNLALLLPLAALCLKAAPCATATQECSEWVALAGGPARSFVYRSFPLTARNDRITRALIVIHGQGRNADDYFRTALAAGFLAGALEDTVIVSPRFNSNDGTGCSDTLAENEVNWKCSGNSWRSGAAALNYDQLTSYDLLDELLRKLARKDVFPNMKRIVLTGHSAGGQYVSRYAMANGVHERLEVPVTYIVSNPSSYAYVDASRPVAGVAEKCAGYDDWPFGLNGRQGYAEKFSDEQLKKQMAARPVTYLLGELDTLPLAGFDSSCPAMAQGPSRLARGQAYAQYMNERHGAHHETVIVPMCGHNARCIYTADPALAVLFPK